MSYLNSHFSCFKSWLPFLFVLIISFGATSNALTQQKRIYFPGEDNTLEMFVHIIGEVMKPGKYRVRDDTNLIELLSEAGGPTQFSNLSAVTITHVESEWLANGQNEANHVKGERITRYNVNKYFKADRILAPPKLKPGDVVLVPSNKWRTWRQVTSVFRDIAVVASAYFLYLRATRD